MFFDPVLLELLRKHSPECKLKRKAHRIGNISLAYTSIMGYRHISRDVKLAAIQLYIRDLLSLDDIRQCCGFSLRTFYRIWRLWQDTGDVVRHSTTLRGRRRILIREDIDYLLSLVRDNPDYFLDELLHLLNTNRFISVHYTTIHNELERANVSRKRLKRIALERNEGRRAAFVAQMAQYAPVQLGFLDETSKDERTLSRGFGRAKKGRRAVKKQVFVRGMRVSTEALLSLDGIVAGTAVQGSMTKEMFYDYLALNVVRNGTLYLHFSL
jgi:transposase